MHADRDKFSGSQAEGALDYQLCNVDGSRLQFRGPMPDCADPFLAVLGGSETFGKYVERPYPALLADWLEIGAANLGVAHAGLSLFSEERALLDIGSRAQVTVLQVLGAQNMSNRLYSVHPRRNDRFLSASPALREIFPTVDFAEINFTGHLLETLQKVSQAGFEVVEQELKWAWLQRMHRILRLIRGDVVLLWLTAPDDQHFIERDMLVALAGDIAGVVEVSLSHDSSLDGMIFPESERDAAKFLPGPADHHHMAEALLPVLARLMESPGRINDPARAIPQSFSVNSGTAANRSATRP